MHTTLRTFSTAQKAENILSFSTIFSFLQPFSGKEERNLWQAVLRQALEDLLGLTREGGADSSIKKALRWFSIRNKDFLSICDMAQISHERVLHVVGKMCKRVPV